MVVVVVPEGPAAGEGEGASWSPTSERIIVPLFALTCMLPEKLDRRRRERGRSVRSFKRQTGVAKQLS